MFGQKYHKQLLKLLPLVEQQGQQQSVYPSNKHNSNDQGSEQCFTPNYNVIQEDQQKNYQKLQNQHENFSYNQDKQQVRDSYQDDQYQKMRENPNIDYQSFFNKKFDFISKQDTQKQQIKTDMNLIKQDEYDFSPANSSFQHLMDSNFRKNQSGQQKKNDTIQKQSFLIQESKDNNKSNRNKLKYHEININGEVLTNQMLLNSQIRWQLIFQLLSLQNSSVFINESSISERIDKLILTNTQEKQQIKQIEKVVDNKSQQIQQLIGENLQNQVDQREKKQFLSIYKYQQTKNSVFKKFKQKASQNIRSLEDSIGKRFQKTNMQLIKAKRVFTHSIETDYKQALEEQMVLEYEISELQKHQNQSLQKIESQLDYKFSLLQDNCHQVKKQFRNVQGSIEEKIQKLGHRVMNYLNKQIIEGKQLQQELVKLLFSLLDKLE